MGPSGDVYSSVCRGSMDDLKGEGIDCNTTNRTFETLRTAGGHGPGTYVNRLSYEIISLKVEGNGDVVLHG